MSNFIRRTKNPRTDQFEDAEWLDNYYGPRKYAVRFPDGGVYEADAFGWEFGDSTEKYDFSSTPEERKAAQEFFSTPEFREISHKLSDTGNVTPNTPNHDNSSGDVMDTDQAWVCRKFWCHNFMYGSEFEALLGCSKHGGLVPDTRLRRFVRRWV